jgi:hypothetical protein
MGMYHWRETISSFLRQEWNLEWMTKEKNSAKPCVAESKDKEVKNR